MSKKKELTRLLTIKEDTKRAQLKLKQSEVEQKNNIATIKLKIKEENKKREKDTVLLAIDNVEWQSSGKATELLKSEEEKTKLQLQMNHESEKLEIIKKESDKLGRKLQDLDQETQTAEVEIHKCIKSTEEMENKLQSKLKKKDVVLEMKENEIKEFENMFIKFQESMFQVRMIEEEMNILKEEMETEMKKNRCQREKKVRLYESGKMTPGQARLGKGLTEPDNGSDASGHRTTATKVVLEVAWRKVVVSALVDGRGLGFVEPTPIQSQGWLKGRDSSVVLVSAPTSELAAQI
ncbi:kinesin-like protein KIN-12E [Tanacetum coccineum]